MDRERAVFSAWYELFPRSTGNAGEHGTFATAEGMLPYVAELGFDIVYLPPIHPVVVTHRKGKNNQLVAEPDDVGSPWAIVAATGGHTDIEQALGTLADFRRFRERAESLGFEVALDAAFQCSPDHPWVREHPDWFRHRPDGSIQYAENPPKKYQDIFDQLRVRRLARPVEHPARRVPVLDVPGGSESSASTIPTPSR